MRLTCVLMTAALLLLAPTATYAAELAQSLPTPLRHRSTTLPSQASADQIASVARQVAQVAIDPSISVESKTQQINSLATQFNQLVLVWQQQTLVTPASGSPVPTPAPGPLTPVPSVAPARGVSTPVTLAATPAPALATAVGTPGARPTEPRRPVAHPDRRRHPADGRHLSGHHPVPRCQVRAAPGPGKAVRPVDARTPEGKLSCERCLATAVTSEILPRRTNALSSHLACSERAVTRFAASFSRDGHVVKPPSLS